MRRSEQQDGAQRTRVLRARSRISPSVFRATKATPNQRKPTEAQAAQQDGQRNPGEGTANAVTVLVDGQPMEVRGQQRAQRAER